MYDRVKMLEEEVELKKLLDEGKTTQEIRDIFGWDAKKYWAVWERLHKKQDKAPYEIGMSAEEYKLIAEQPTEKNHYLHYITESLCFSCRRCNADMCRWFWINNPKPVDGWDARPRMLSISGKRGYEKKIQTYDVRHCPNFVPDRRADTRRVADNERWKDDKRRNATNRKDKEN